MSVRFSVLLLDETSGGDLELQTGADVDLYQGASPNVGVDPKVDFTEIATKGLYYVDVSASLIYTVVVDGAIQVNMQGIKIDANEGTWGQGSTDNDISYAKLTNATGQELYIFPNSTGNGLNVQLVKP